VIENRRVGRAVPGEHYRKDPASRARGTRPSNDSEKQGFCRGCVRNSFAHAGRFYMSVTRLQLNRSSAQSN